MHIFFNFFLNGRLRSLIAILYSPIILFAVMVRVSTYITVQAKTAFSPVCRYLPLSRCHLPLRAAVPDQRWRFAYITHIGNPMTGIVFPSFHNKASSCTRKYWSPRYSNPCSVFAIAPGVQSSDLPLMPPSAYKSISAS